MSPVVDCVSNLFTPEVVATRPSWTRQHLAGRFGVAETTFAGISVVDQLAAMDAAGVDVAILLAPVMGPSWWPGHWSLPAQPVLDVVADFPDRFRCQVGIDPMGDVRGVPQLRRLVEDSGVVGAHFYPHWFDMAPDDRRAYPFYAACQELGIPMQVQVGNALQYTGDRVIRSLGEPWRLDAVACDFPDLVLIGSHVGWPWTEEMVAMATGHPNVYIAVDSYAPRHWGPALDRFATGPGARKILFGTMWPTLSFDRAVQEVRAKGLSEEATAAILGGNADRVYGLSA